MQLFTLSICTYCIYQFALNNVLHIHDVTEASSTYDESFEYTHINHTYMYLAICFLTSVMCRSCMHSLVYAFFDRAEVKRRDVWRRTPVCPTHLQPWNECVTLFDTETVWRIYNMCIVHVCFNGSSGETSWKFQQLYTIPTNNKHPRHIYILFVFVFVDFGIIRFYNSIPCTNEPPLYPGTV